MCRGALTPLVPNAHIAVIDERKITHYLFSRTHRLGGPKAIFFESFGYELSDPQPFRTALLAHALTYDVTTTYPTAFGQVYEVVGPLDTPDGRNPTVLVAWIIRTGEHEPRLVTVVPS